MGIFLVTIKIEVDEPTADFPLENQQAGIEAEVSNLWQSVGIFAQTARGEPDWEEMRVKILESSVEASRYNEGEQT